MISKIQSIVKELAIPVRLVLADGTETEWSNWLICPEPGYLEVRSAGPHAVREVQYLEINSIVMKKLGRLLPEKRIDHSEQVSNALTVAGIQYSECGNGIYRCSVGSLLDAGDVKD